MKRLRWTCGFASLACCLGQTLPGFGQSAPSAKDSFDATEFGAKADGKTDDTAAIQKALDSASQKGGVVNLPAGNYVVAGNLKIPPGVAQGVSRPIRKLTMKRVYEVEKALQRKLSEAES